MHPLRIYLLAATAFFVSWTLISASGMLVGYLVQDVMRGAGSLPEYSEVVTSPLQPLSPAELEDPAARARWRAAFDARRARGRSEAADANARIQAGVQRVTDLLPFLVGLLLVPVLAALSWALTVPWSWRRGARGPPVPGEASSPGYMEHVVLSTHVHAVGYFAFAVVVLFGTVVPPDVALLLWPVGFAAVTFYLLASLQRNFAIGPVRLLLAAVVTPFLYIIGFWVIAWTAVRALVGVGVIA